MADIKPYTIAIEDSRISDLKQRLSLAKFPDELDGAGWEMGSSLADVKRLAAHWESAYDWRAAERDLNSQLPHFVTDIQCDGGFEPLAIHFVHVKSGDPNAVPLLFFHGWPGHYLEVSKIIRPLAEGGGDGDLPAFDIVAPSLPNFGFSQGTKKRGFALEQYAETVNKLMLKLGYNEYVTQGGDWGTHISRSLALLYPQHCKATHLNYEGADPPSWLHHPLLALRYALTPATEYERRGAARSRWFQGDGYGYNAEQSTRPQTLGYGLADSPVALLAWIYEKLHDWTDGYAWTDDEVCTWVSIYWFSAAGPAASVRIYYETAHNVDGRANKIDRHGMRVYTPGVKLGFSRFPMDLSIVPSAWLRTLGEVVFERVHESGGHFAAWERPEELVADVRAMYGRGGGAFDVVKGRSGYAS